MSEPTTHDQDAPGTTCRWVAIVMQNDGATDLAIDLPGLHSSSHSAWTAAREALDTLPGAFGISVRRVFEGGGHV